MEFVQIIEYQTSKPEEVKALLEEFRSMREKAGGPMPTQVIATADRDRPNTYLSVVRFGSYEEAMENSRRDDTTEMAQRMAALCDGPPTFRNLDVIMQY